MNEVSKIVIQIKENKKAIENESKDLLNIKTEKEFRELGVMDPKTAYEAQFIDIADVYSKYYDDGIWDEIGISKSLFSEKYSDDIAIDFLRQKLGYGSELRKDIEGSTPKKQCKEIE